MRTLYCCPQSGMVRRFSHIRGGHVGVATLLLERGADVNTPNDRGNTALHLAAGFGHEEVVSILLGSGAGVFRRGAADWTVLMCGSYSGSVAVVRLLLQAMGRRGLDARSESGYTALWYACFGGHVIILRALLLAGADHTIADNDRTTPQRFAQSRCVPLFKVSTVFSCDTYHSPQCIRDTWTD
jgi:ankyrin repeat protein